MSDVWDKIGESFQRNLDKKTEIIKEKIDFYNIDSAEKFESELMYIQIRDWTEPMLNHDGLVLNINDIVEQDKVEAEIIASEIFMYWELEKIRDSVEFEKNNTIVLQKLLKHAQTSVQFSVYIDDAEKEIDWKEYMENRIMVLKKSIFWRLTKNHLKYDS